MTLTDVLEARYSVRQFSGKKVEEEKLISILEAARTAPTAKNLQPQRIYLLESETALKTIRSLTRMTFDAPQVLLVCANMQEAWVNPFNGRSSAEMDASIAASQMMLKITELGLGSTWVCWFDTAQIKAAFQLPETTEPYCLLPFGYPAEDCRPSSSHASRKPLNELTFRI